MSEPTDVTRPAKVEVGQRWRDERGPYIVTSVDEAVGLISFKRDGGGIVSGGCMPQPKEDFLGWAPGYAPQPPGAPGVPMEEDGYGDPARCLRCGGPKGGLWFSCQPCRGEPGEWHITDALHGAWKAGARDFPRSADSPEAIPGPTCDYCAARAASGSGLCTIHAPNTAKPVVAATPAVTSTVTGQCDWHTDKIRCVHPRAHRKVTFCEYHIAAAMVFNDGCRLKPVLFPVIPEHQPPRQQSHASERGCLGVWSLRAR